MAKKKNLFDTVVDNVKNLFTPKQVAPKVTTPAKTAVKTTPSTVQQPRAISAVNVKLPDLKKQNVYTNTINRATNPTVKTVPTTTTRAATPVSTTVRTNTTRRTVSLPAVRTAADTRTYNRFGGNVVSPSAIQQTMNSRGYYARKVVAPVRNTLTTKENVAKSNVYGSTKKLGFSFDNSKVNKWLKTGYKMTSKDSKEAKKMYAEYSKFVNSQGEDYYKRSTSDGTAEHALDTAMRQVLLKTNGILGSMMAGTASSNNLTTKAADAAVSKANEKAGISSDYNNPYSSAMNTAQENHPIAYTAGNAIGKMGQYALFNDVAGDLGVSQALQSQLAKRIPQKAAEVASNLIVGQAADTALDTVPTVVENNLNGKYKNDPNQMAKDILANQATNLAYNIAGEGLGAVNNAIGKKLLDINTQKAAQAAQNDQFIKKLSDIANTQDTSIPQTPNNLYDLARKVNATAPVTSIPDVATDTVKTSNIPDLVTGATKSTSSATFDPSQSSGLRFYDTKLGKYVTEDGKTIPDIKPGEKVSDVFSNTATTDKVLSQDVAEGTLDPNDFKYDVHNQGNAVTRAQERVANNADQLYDDYMSGEARKIRDNGVYDDEDSANMMELSRHYSTEARNSTDEMSRAQNSVKSKRILMELRKNSTKSGQFNSILQQYANTADNLALKGNGIVADKAETWVKNNPAVSNDISKLSSQIENVLNKHNASEVFANGSQADVEALRSKLTDEIQAIIKKHDPSTRKALKGLSEDAISEILNSKQADDIASTLDFFASSRSTGVKESTMQTVEDLMTEAQKYGENSKQRVQLEGQAYAAIANDIGRKGGTFKDKFDSLRYLNMLCSPKTHAKNVANNIIFSDAIMGTKDNLAAVIEAGVDRVNKAFGGAGIDRTKSVLNPFSETDRSLISSCYKDASDSAYRQLDNGNKYYDVGSSIEQAIPAFSNENWLGKFINNWSNFNTKALDTEDQMTMIQKYTTSLAGYLKANGKDVSILNSSADADKQFMEGARKYAISQAEEAAFHQTGMFGSAAAKFGKFNNELESSALENGEPNAASRALGYAGNIVVPFKKTPANILATALSYSPANALRTVIFDTANLKAKRITAAKYIDEMAKSATGSSLVLLGGILAHEGIVGIDYLDDKTQSN